MEGLLRNDTNIHAGIRTTLSGPSDYENDGYCGFEIVEAREIDTIGTQYSQKVNKGMNANPEQESTELSRKSETESAPRTRSTSPSTSTR